ncbi:hypothetical protein [Flavobacterium sp.]|nr:hypothetical protein [Flavobacterium sp.]MDG2433282.1 hypothetical protein [Flavobacterium sp.]
MIFDIKSKTPNPYKQHTIRYQSIRGLSSFDAVVVFKVVQSKVRGVAST